MNIDTTLFKNCMSKYTTGITLVTTKNNAKNIGIIINSFNSVSLSPLLILFCLNKKSYHYSTLKNCHNFTVNILSKHNKNIVNLFTKHHQDPWSNLELHTQHPITSSPAIKNSLAFIECSMHSQFDGGDHSIIIGKVENLFNDTKNNDPLIYYKSNFYKI